jgi:hypothetical protein
VGNLKGRAHLEDVNMVGMIILKCILKYMLELLVIGQF